LVSTGQLLYSEDSGSGSDDDDDDDDDDIVVRYILFHTLIDLLSNFSLYRTGVYSVGIKLFNSLYNV
jgi:hypothetical protein